MIFLRRALALPLLFYRVFFKKWANRHENKFLDFVNSRPKNEGTVTFIPESPRRNAALRNALAYMGFEVMQEDNPTITVAWEDETYKKQLPEHNGAINGGCFDISKSYVDQIHHEVFGYGIEADPNTQGERILEKSDINGAHQARIVTTPVTRRDGFMYQKLIDTRKGLLYEDIRPVVVGNQIPFCYLNYRVEGKRFSAKKIKAKLVKTGEVLNETEQEGVLLICKKMGVDVAEVDCLRDRNDGRIYVVDVNPTAYGPANGLSFDQKLDAIKMYENALKPFLKDSFGISV